MNRLSIDKGFALLNCSVAFSSKDLFGGRFLSSISHAEQDFGAIAWFSGEANFLAKAKILHEKILTSQNSQTLHKMAYFDVKGRGEIAKHKN